MGVRDRMYKFFDHTGWRIGFVCGITTAAMAVALFAYSGQKQKADQRAEFNKRRDAVYSIDSQLRKAADKDKNGLDVFEVRSIAKAAGYNGKLPSIDSIMVYDPEQKRDFDGGMLNPRSDMYVQGKTLYVPVSHARRAEVKLRTE